MDLICKPRSKSLVWMYFGLKANGKGQPLNYDEAICRLCRKVVLAKGGNTTNLRSHLTRRHRTDSLENTSWTTPGAFFETQGNFQPHCLHKMMECQLYISVLFHNSDPHPSCPSPLNVTFCR